MLIHPIRPVFDKDSRILILGSFPSVKSKEEGFFYGHEYEFKTLEQLQKAMEEYIEYYNNERIQVKLNGLTPCQARNQSLYSF